jgi:hypothetical protein
MPLLAAELALSPNAGHGDAGTEDRGVTAGTAAPGRRPLEAGTALHRTPGWVVPASYGRSGGNCTSGPTGPGSSVTT